jgi:hypothetical protein
VCHTATDLLYCKGITFQLAHAAKHVSEVEHLKEPEVAAM